MKRLSFAVFAVALLLFFVKPTEAGPLTAQVISSNTSEALTAAAPTTSTQGLDLQGVSGYRVSVCAVAGQTLSGAGTLDAYSWIPAMGTWGRNPALDLAIAGVTGSRCESFGDLETYVPRGRVFYAAVGVTVSGGSTVNVIIEATQQ